uniref:Uncharacterized protein n=1 Tax=Branchiostoma floridae TaxID=7739 RepID=C3ZVS5_BRAFL|eukprot:XP_002587329.1 hypothetical protein BRAFLDRAFT_100525 [Branchiostoma floridae]
MYEQAQPVRCPISGVRIGQTRVSSSKTTPRGQHRPSKDNNTKMCSQNTGSSSSWYEEAEAVYHTINDQDVPPPLPNPRSAQHTRPEVKPPQASIVSENSDDNVRCETHTSTVLQGDLHNAIKQLTAFETLKRQLDIDGSRITFLEERLQEMTKKLEITGENVESKISFGGRGSEQGKFNGNYGVAVSADNEIFVTDYHNKRVQVFGMNGMFLRLFPTKMLLEHKHTLIYPYGVAVDTFGNVWVTGVDNDKDRPQAYIIKYSSKGGLPLTIFNKPTEHMAPTIAIDKRKNKIVVVLSNEILMFLPNGSLSQSFVMTHYEVTGLYPLTSDENGNVIIADYDSVHVYSDSGYHKFSFKGEGKDTCQMLWVSGICVDTSGNIIVANTGNNRIDMFTKEGEFVRTIVRMTGPGALVMGPDGQLVVISTNAVTVFQPKVLFL